jgi:hypothetical protein
LSSEHVKNTEKNENKTSRKREETTMEKTRYWNAISNIALGTGIGTPSSYSNFSAIHSLTLAQQHQTKRKVQGRQQQ